MSNIASRLRNAMTIDNGVPVLVDIFWTHPMAREDVATEHKCHKVQMITVPGTFFLHSDNKRLHEFFAGMFKDPYTGRSIVAKVSCLYNEWLSPEKIIVFLNSPLRVEPLEASELFKNETEPNRE